MKFSQKIIISIMFAILILLASLFVKLIPCQTSPNVPNPEYKWALCDLNPDNPITGMSVKYLSYTESLKTTYLVTLATAFIISLFLISLLFKSKSQH